MSELSSQARDLLAEARAGLEPDAARLARGRERMLAATTAAAASAVVGTAAVTGVPAVGAPAIASTAAPIAPATQAAGLGAPALVSLGVAVLAVVVAAVLLVPRLGSSSSGAAPRVAAPSRPAPAVVERVAAPAAVDTPATPDHAIDLDDITLETAPPTRTARPPSPSAPAVAVAPGPAEPPAETVAPAEPPAPADSLTRELSWLRAARAALRAGTPDAALIALASYQREFTAGQLAEEAAALAVEAACAAGRGDVEARRAAFMRQWPTSTARARVERACR